MSSLLFVSGSLRQDSANSAAIRAARRSAERDPRVVTTGLLPLVLPFYDGDVEAAGTPHPVHAAREAVRVADALIISTPAYNGAPPGVLKNLLDWLSRPAGASVLDGKLVATMSASPGRLGAADSQQQLRMVLARCGCSVVEYEPLVAIGDALRKCSPSGELADAEALFQIEQLVDTTVAALESALLTAGATE
ncbi:NADPH-dependent FMN reductase [Streptomyces sp. NPDC052101]|uniref:NADPH-dependent FMN reductase n=1 Tax=Streptomyces sp. NPDC052101 TaxID=3155763 RepID=UPI0034353321